MTSKWISTAERLPDPLIREVLILATGDTIDLANICGGNHVRWRGRLGSWEMEEVKYWMPIPEIPQHN